MDLLFTKISTGIKKLNYLVDASIHQDYTLQIKKLSQSLDSLKISDRNWLLIELKATGLLSVNEIADKLGGITRGRIYQIIDQIIERVRINLDSFSVFFDFFEKRSIELRDKSLGASCTIDTFIDSLSQGLMDDYLYATNEEIKKLIALTSVLIMHKKPWVADIIEAKWRNVAFLSCSVYITIDIDRKIEQSVTSQRLRQSEDSYKTLAISVLNKFKKPMHWSEIAKHAENLSNRHVFQTGAFYNALLSHEDTFVRVGQGTYELVEWGSKQAEPYTEIIAAVLKKENQAVSFDLILAKVSSARLIKQQTLSMYLDMHPRFYRSINGVYGLRIWLPPRENQNLRTPEWLVEDSKSVERVERARQKGYDIESIVAEDKLK